MPTLRAARQVRMALRDQHPPGDEAGRALILPGRNYAPGKPLLEVVTEVLLAHGWAVREVRWQLPEGLSDRKATAWVADQARTAAAGWADRPLVIGKSLGTRAASYAAKERLDAVWLTPLLRDRTVVRGIRRNPGRQLVVAGTADHIAWDARAAESLRADVVALPDADHQLAVPGDQGRTAAHLERLRKAVDAWLP